MHHTIKPGPWFLGRLGRKHLGPGDVSGALVRPDVMGTGPYSDEIHTCPGLHAREDWALYLFP